MLLNELFSPINEATYASVYYNPRTGEYANVEKRRDGSYYGWTNKYDFRADNEQELLAKLKSWGFKIDPVGAEKIHETGGVGVVAANKKMAKDPRYSMSQTVDIGPGETQKQAAKFGNKTDKMGLPPKLRADGKVTEAAMSTTIQGRMPVSAGARGLMAARWKYDRIVKDSESKNLDNATAQLSHRLKDLDQGLDYDSIDKTMRSICDQHHIMPKELHNAFISRYNLTPDKYAAKIRHERKNKPKSV